MTAGGLGNQTPLIIRRRSSTIPGRFFILNRGHGADDDDSGGEPYHWTAGTPGASRQLSNSPGARVIYYRTDGATPGSYFASGRIDEISSHEDEDGLEHHTATVDQFEPFAQPVAFADGPPRDAGTWIQPITRVQFEKLLKAGGEKPAEDFDLDGIRSATEAAGLTLAPEIYAQLLAALVSGKHVILTGPQGAAASRHRHAPGRRPIASGLAPGHHRGGDGDGAHRGPEELGAPADRGPTRLPATRRQSSAERAGAPRR